MPTSSDIYPYLAVPFTLTEYIVAYKHIRDPSSHTPFYTVRLEKGPPVKIKLSYSPRSVFCWVSAGKGRQMGNSSCTFTACVGQEVLSINQDDLSVNVPLVVHCPVSLEMR